MDSFQIVVISTLAYLIRKVSKIDYPINKSEKKSDRFYEYFYELLQLIIIIVLLQLEIMLFSYLSNLVF